MEILSSTDSAIVEFVKVTKIYPPDVIALRDISFTVKKGKMLFLTGMSGAGKTTLLKLICAIEHPTKGLVEINGMDLSKIKTKELQKIRQKIGVAYQDFKLLPKHTVYQNIAMPMEVTYTPQKTMRNRIGYLLDVLNLSSKKDVKSEKLSRGEQQRVAIARAAANYPPLLLADEPTGNLDPTHSKMVVKLFEQLNRAGTTLIIATHDQSIYRNSSHQVLDLTQGQLRTLVPEEQNNKVAKGGLL